MVTKENMRLSVAHAPNGLEQAAKPTAPFLACDSSAASISLFRLYFLPPIVRFQSGAL